MANKNDQISKYEREIDSFDRLFYFCAENGYDNVLYPKSMEKREERDEIIKLEKLEENRKKWSFLNQ